MKFLTKLYFLNPVAPDTKQDFFIYSGAIDLLTWYKHAGSSKEGTNILTSLSSEDSNVNYMVDGTPENVNQIAFDGIFYKCTAHYLGKDGGMKSFSAWINPDNIVIIYSNMPDDCSIYFKSGRCVLVVAKLAELIKSLIEHGNKIKERKKMKYGKKPEIKA